MAWDMYVQQRVASLSALTTLVALIDASGRLMCAAHSVVCPRVPITDALLTAVGVPYAPVVPAKLRGCTSALVHAASRHVLSIDVSLIAPARSVLASGVWTREIHHL